MTYARFPAIGNATQCNAMQCTVTQHAVMQRCAQRTVTQRNASAIMALRKRSQEQI